MIIGGIIFAYFSIHLIVICFIVDNKNEIGKSKSDNFEKYYKQVYTINGIKSYTEVQTNAFCFYDSKFVDIKTCIVSISDNNLYFYPASPKRDYYQLADISGEDYIKLLEKPINFSLSNFSSYRTQQTSRTNHINTGKLVDSNNAGKGAVIGGVLGGTTGAVIGAAIGSGQQTTKLVSSTTSYTENYYYVYLKTNDNQELSIRFDSQGSFDSFIKNINDYGLTDINNKYKQKQVELSFNELENTIKAMK